MIKNRDETNYNRWTIDEKSGFKLKVKFSEMDSLETPDTSDLDEDSLVMGADSFATERLSTQERLRLAKKRRAEQVKTF